MISKDVWPTREQDLRRYAATHSNDPMVVDFVNRALGDRTKDVSRTYIPFTEDEDVTIIEMWGINTVSAIAKKLGRTYDSVYQRGVRMGLSKRGDMW